MQAIILRIATRYLGPLLLLLSFAVLYRGHQLPGGGFIGGLIAAAAYLLMVLARGWERMLQRLPIRPRLLVMIGLGIAAASGLPGQIADGVWFSGQWLPPLSVPLLGQVKLGTPVLFDIGVYCVVLGFVLQSAIVLSREENF